MTKRGLLLALSLTLAGCGYSGLVQKKNACDAAWSDVDVQLQRRADLIPNLVNIVKAYAGHESQLLTAIASAESAWKNASSPDQKMQAANLFPGMGAFLTLSTQFPQLKSNEQFNRLMDELAGTENRVAVARKRYNDAVMAYNDEAQGLFTGMTARMFGFPPSKPFFKAQAGAENAPKVDFTGLK